MDHHIQRAEHAIRTGQPNLAMTYMRRRLSDSPEGRAWLARRDFIDDTYRTAREAGIILDAVFGYSGPLVTPEAA